MNDNRWHARQLASSFLLPYKRQIAYALVALLLTATITLSIGQGVRLLIDQGIATASADLLIAQVIVSIMPDIAARLAPDGTAILSGIIEERVPDIYAALNTQNLECVKKISQEEWVALVVCRKK